MDYLERNMTLTIDVLTLIDLVKLKLEFILKIDMVSLDNTECYNNTDDDDDDDGDNENLVAHALLQEVSGVAYTRVTTKLINKTNIDPNVFPSRYKLTIDRPDIASY